jgi:hypothetical protein
MAGTTIICPMNNRSRPVFDVSVPNRNRNPSNNNGRVTKASPNELLRDTIDSIYHL